MKNLWIVLSASLLMASSTAFAGATVWSTGAGEKISIEDSATPGSKVAFVKADGVKSAWAGKIIKVHYADHYMSNSGAYVFDYKKKKGLNRDKVYVYILETDAALIKGSLVKVISVYFPENKKQAMKFYYDADASAAAGNLGLEKAYAATPFVPEIE